MSLFDLFYNKSIINLYVIFNNRNKILKNYFHIKLKRKFF